jgi:putative transposase
MRGPKPPPVALTAEERAQLEALARRHGTAQQLALRARLVPAAAAGATNAPGARRWGVSVGTARLWRARWLALAPLPRAELGVAERLADAPRPGGPARITAAQVCQLAALACAAPAGPARPTGQWTGRAIADEALQRGGVAAISPRHAARLRKRGRASRTASATG